MIGTVFSFFCGIVAVRFAIDDVLDLSEAVWYYLASENDAVDLDLKTRSGK